MGGKMGLSPEEKEEVIRMLGARQSHSREGTSPVRIMPEMEPGSPTKGPAIPPGDWER